MPFTPSELVHIQIFVAKFDKLRNAREWLIKLGFVSTLKLNIIIILNYIQNSICRASGNPAGNPMNPNISQFNATV